MVDKRLDGSMAEIIIFSPPPLHAAKEIIRDFPRNVNWLRTGKMTGRLTPDCRCLLSVKEHKR